MDFSIGRWMLVSGSYGGSLNPDILEIVKTTEKLVKYVRYGTNIGQVSKADVIATFALKQEAQKLQQALHGIRGERDQRIQAAHLAAKKQADDLIAVARQESAS